jgi:hypothetical protein
MTEAAPDRRRPKSLRIEALLGLGLTLVGLVVAGVGMSSDLEGPWQRGWKAHNGGRYAQIARNYARWGFTHAGGAPVLDVEPGPGQPAPTHDADVYAHHPPGVMMVTGLVFRLFGVSERTARLMSFLATLASLAVLARLVAAAAGPLAGGAAALLCGSLPMTVVFGTHVEVQGPLVLLAGLATLLSYRRWLGGGSLVPWLAVSAVASWFDWFGLYYAAACAVHALLAGRGWSSALRLAGWVAALFCGWLAWLSSLPGMSWRRVLGAAGVRIDGGVGASDEAFERAVSAWWTASQGLMPVWPLLLVLTLFVALGVGRGGESRARIRSTLLLLVAPPVVHSALFPAGMVLHSYWLFALPAALAAGLGIGLARLRPAVCVAGALLAALVFSARVEEASEHVDVLPHLLGEAINANTDPGEGVLTNFEVNVLWTGMEVGEYIVSRPEVSYYAERPVRGGVAGRPQGRAVGLAEARRLLPSARWFLLWPDQDDGPALQAALVALGGREPIRLKDDPPVLLYPLTP